MHKLVTHKRHLNDTQLHAHYLLNCLPKKCTLELISLVAGVPTCHLSSSSNKHLQLEVGQSCLQLINIQPFLHSSTLQTSASSFFPNTCCFISLCGINSWENLNEHSSFCNCWLDCKSVKVGFLVYNSPEHTVRCLVLACKGTKRNQIKYARP